jgi:protease IV
MRFVLLLALVLLTGCGTPAFLVRPVSTSDELEQTVVKPGKSYWTDSKIAILPIDGTIANARVGGILSGSENMVALLGQQLDAAERDPSVKAIVLRINSPGGTVTGSDTVYDMVMRFRARSKKPVIASCQEVTASGGYYIACAADVIVASPTSLVGSIGVIFQTVSIEGGMKMLGIKATPIKSGKMKDIGSPFHDPTDEEKLVMQAMVDEYFARFKTIVSTRRNLTQPGQIEQVSDGRVFSGAVAQKLGLVDQLGSLDDAIELAKQKSGATDAAVILYRRPYGPGGNIYATAPAPVPQHNSPLGLPLQELWIPTGVYYLWRP